MALSASWTAPCTIATVRVDTMGLWPLATMAFIVVSFHWTTSLASAGAKGTIASRQVRAMTTDIMAGASPVSEFRTADGARDSRPASTTSQPTGCLQHAAVNHRADERTTSRPTG